MPRKCHWVAVFQSIPGPRLMAPGWAGRLSFIARIGLCEQAGQRDPRRGAQENRVLDIGVTRDKGLRAACVLAELALVTS